MTRQLSIVLCFSVSFSIASAQIPQTPPADIPTTDSLVSIFRDDLKSKVQQILTNYVNNVLNDHVSSFVSADSTKCNDGTVIASGGQVARIEKTSEIVRAESQTDQLTETISYFGCNGKVAFSEVFYSEGLNLVPFDWMQILTSQISYSIKPNENFKRVRIMNEQNVEVFSVTGRRDSRRIFVNFHFNLQPVLTFLEVTQDDAIFSIYNVKPYEANIDIDSDSYSYGRSGNSEFSVLIKKEGDIVYRDKSKERVSFGAWLQNFSTATFSKPDAGVLGVMQSVMDSYLKRLPETVLVGSVGQNKRILSELNLALSQLNSGGLQINQVKILIRDYIDAITSGKLDIVDNRPKN
jgi:hypothetical protein